MEENQTTVSQVISQDPVPVKNKGGRPRKYPIGYKPPRGKAALAAIANQDQSILDLNMMGKLLKAQDTATNNLEAALASCTDPQKLTSAMLNLRELMDKVKGNKASIKAKEVENALKVGNDTWTRQKALEIASGAKTVSDIAKIIQSK